MNENNSELNRLQEASDTLAENLEAVQHQVYDQIMCPPDSIVPENARDFVRNAINEINSSRTGNEATTVNSGENPELIAAAEQYLDAAVDLGTDTDVDSTSSDDQITAATTTTSQESSSEESPAVEAPQKNSESGEIIVEHNLRYRGAPWFDRIAEANITIVGIGGIGSHVAFLLSRVSPKSLYLIDGDYVELVNLSGQMFGINDVGRAKANALCDFLRTESNYFCTYTFVGMLDSDSALAVSPIMICGLDSMHSRKEVFSLWKRKFSELDNALFIDGRLSAEEFQIYCIPGNRPDLIERYEKTLFNDSEAEAAVCSYKQTTYCASAIASHIVNLLINWEYNKTSPIIPRYLPFFVYYSAELMMLKAEL